MTVRFPSFPRISGNDIKNNTEGVAQSVNDFFEQTTNQLQKARQPGELIFSKTVEFDVTAAPEPRDQVTILETDISVDNFASVTDVRLAQYFYSKGNSLFGIEGLYLNWQFISTEEGKFVRIRVISTAPEDSQVVRTFKIRILIEGDPSG